MSRPIRGHAGAVDPETFADLTADALAHMYDLPYLQTHPLGTLLGARARQRPTEPRGAALHALLLEAIQSLRPTDRAVGSPHGWRTYRYLFLRYVQALSPRDVARGLAISDRQARRVYREAIDALASLLWDRYIAAGAPAAGALIEPAERPDQGAAGDVLRPPQGGTGRGDALLEEEIDRLTRKGQGRTADLAEVVNGLRSILDPLAARYGHCWSGEVPSDLPRVAVERSVLRQILLGILAPLLERTAGPVSLWARAAHEMVEITITAVVGGRPPPADWGSALEERLVVSRRLVEADGGDLSVELSAADVRIRVRVPSARRGSVVVIDDNVDVITVFRRYLEAAGLEVHAAETGMDGFRLVKAVRPGAVTLDVMMAAQDGWETLQLIKNDPETHAIPVIVCTVLREEGLARFLGASEVLPKPVRRADLLAALARCGLPVRAEGPGSSP
jgi:CheY-like chemotaxis protein